MQIESKEFTISWGALWRILAMLALVSILFVSREILVALFLAIIISSALDPFVTWFEKKRIPRILGTLAIYILAIFIVALIIYIIVPIFLVQLNNLLSGSGDALGSFLNSFNSGSSEILSSINGYLDQLTASLFGGKVTLLSVVSKFLGGFLFTIIVFVISFYLTVGRDGVEKFLIAIMPYSIQPRVLHTYERVRMKISKWFVGQLFLSAIMAVAVFIGLSILGVKYALLIGVVAGALELIPYVGPIFSGSLAVLFAINTSFSLAVYTLILFIILQQIEGHILIPQVIGLTTNLSPVVVLIALMVGGQVLGIVGILIAVPAAVLFQEILKTWTSSHPAERAINTP
jgi:predicted PurR-regulated permease PerM